MENQQVKCMEAFVDKLCDHLPAQRIKLLIDNGFDEWETITYLKGHELIELGFDAQECLVIMVSANTNAKEQNRQEIFNEQTIQNVIQIAKEKDKEKWEKLEKEEEEKKSSENSPNTGSSAQLIKEYPRKEISENMLFKGTQMKPKPNEKITLNKITMISLEDKEITHMSNVERVPGIVNLHLGTNHIANIEGLSNLTKIKVLKLEHNQITKIDGLDSLVFLQRLNLADNYICRFQNLTNNKNLHNINISRQKINTNFTFDPESTYALGYSLEKLECDRNKVNSITELKYLSVIHEISLAKNELSDVGELSQTLTNLEMLKTLNFKDNPLAKTQKYRDYIVILAKSLEELDGKKILKTQRQYLVKLYALKHAKQNKEAKQKPKIKEPFNLEGVRVDEEFGHHNLNKATDLRGNMPFMNTKHAKK